MLDCIHTNFIYIDVCVPKFHSCQRNWKKKKNICGLHSRNDWGQENGENRELSIHTFTLDKTCTV